MQKLTDIQREILKEKFIYYKDASEETLKLFVRDKNKYFLDTENAPVFAKEVVDKYNLTEVEFNTLDVFKIPGKTDQDVLNGITDEVIKERMYNCKLNTMLRNREISTEVYILMLGCTATDTVLWFNNIEQYIEFMQELNVFKIKSAKKKVTIEPFHTFVHNLAWEKEFFLYYLKDNKFEQQWDYGDFTANKEFNSEREMSFNVTENEGQVHRLNIQLQHTEIFKPKCRKNGKDVTYNFLTTIAMQDSMKITPFSLEKISKSFLPNMDKMYVKDGEDYQYQLVRYYPYQPTELESWYCYCDIYILKHWYTDYVVPYIIEPGVKNPCSISQIAFDMILKATYADGILREKYHPVGADKPLKDREIYEIHFDLDYIETAKDGLFKEYFRHSYKGGHTHAGRTARERSERGETIIGTSCDITSSYPSVVCSSPTGVEENEKNLLPYGRPVYYTGAPKLDYFIDGEHLDFHFVTIAFDGWRSKDINNEFGLNVKMKKDEDGDDSFRKALNCSANESSTTNIVNGKFAGQNRIKVKHKERAQLVDKFKKHKYILTVPYIELVEWLKDYDFFTFNYNTLRREKGIKYIDTVSMRSEEGHFKKGTMVFYDIKDNATDEVEKLNAKLYINSFYGKHASNRDRKQSFYDFDQEIISFHTQREEDYEEKYRNEWEDKKLFAVYYASAITGHARIKLRKMVRALGGKDFLYADTDSIYLGLEYEKMVEVVQERGLKISGINCKKALGLFDIEKKFVDSNFLGQKKYQVLERDSDKWATKCCGLPADVREQIKTKDDFKIGKMFTKRQKRKVPGGTLILDVPYMLNDLILFS